MTVGVENDRVVSLEPDTSRYPYDEGIMKTCLRWKKNLEVLESPERVNYPLKRVGERGSGKWQRVSWEEALDDIAERLKNLSEKQGPQTLSSSIGGPHASYWPLHRFLNLFGTPNNMGIGQICWNPHIWTDSIIFGWPVEADLNLELTKSVFLWGTNPADSDNSLFWRSLLNLKKLNIPLVVVDSRKSKTAKRADLHLMIHPGTDNTLALSMIHVIIEEEIYDKEFVDRWCKGFDELAQRAKDYSPEKVSEICRVPADDIRQAARIFAQNTPTTLLSGRGLDQLGPNTVPTHRCLASLRAITGNIDRPGASYINDRSDFIPEVELEMSSSLSQEQRDTSLNKDLLSLQTYEGYERVCSDTKKRGRVLPMRYLTSAHPDLVWKAMIEEEPYPIKALIVMGCNPVLTYADTNRVVEALRSLDLLVVLEYYKTSTAQLADYILPSAGALERPLFQAHGGVANFAYGGPAAVKPYYERRADYEVFRELGIRLGQEKYWPDETMEEAFARTLEPSGMTWEEFCVTGNYFRHPGYFKHEDKDEDGNPLGFGTCSGKIELASDVLEELGYERVPSGDIGQASRLRYQEKITDKVAAYQDQYAETVDHSECLDNVFDLILITGARVQPFYASSYFQDEEFRKLHPYPLVEMSEKTAADHGLVGGDTVAIVTDKGEAVFKTHICEMIDDVVSAEYGWWYPEIEEGEAHELSGAWNSNINVITSSDATKFDYLVGTWSYNGIPCAIRKVETELPTL